MVQYILCTSKWSVAQERDDEKDMEGQEEQKEKTSKRKTLIKDLTEGSVPRELMLFALPLALSGVLQAVYNMVDMVVVGRCLESAGVSAVSIGGDLMMVLTFVAWDFPCSTSDHFTVCRCKPPRKGFQNDWDTLYLLGWVRNCYDCDISAVA